MALRSQVSLLGVGLGLRTDTRFPQNGPPYDLVVGCEVTGSISQAGAAAEIVRQPTAPAPARVIEGWLAELSVIVVRRADDEFAEALRLEAYASRLAQFPGDVARAAILGRSWKFWPAWSELEAECERLVAPRKHMLAALLSPKEPEPEPEPRCDPDRAKEVLAEFGFTPRRFAAVKTRSMATRADDLEREVEADQAKHWTDVAEPGSAEMEQLRKARIAAGMIQAGASK